MKVTVKRLRSIIREVLGGSRPDEAYDKVLQDDPSLKKHSVYVPDDIKSSVKKWSKEMGLSRKQKRRRSS